MKFKQAPPISSAWAYDYLDKVCGEMRSLGQENIYKPGSQYWVCLLKVGSLLKAERSPIRYPYALKLVLAFSPDWLKIPLKDIEYQFGRAIQKAKPLEREF